jgi:CRP/FNR family transcriptional regulator
VSDDALLQAFGFFDEATESERRDIKAAVTAIHLEPGDVFLRQDEPSGEFALVQRGDIRVFKTAPNGREVTLYHVRAGQACLVNMVSVVLQREAIASAIVVDPTDALIVPGDIFRKLLTTNGTLQRFVFQTVAARLGDVMLLVEEVTVRRMDARLASWLLRVSAIQRDKVTIPVTHDTLAIELGTAREVVSRLLKDFERRGAVRLLRGRVRLLDERVLAQIAFESP